MSVRLRVVPRLVEIFDNLLISTRTIVLNRSLEITFVPKVSSLLLILKISCTAITVSTC